MRKLMVIMLVIILILGGAMALAEYRENGGSFKNLFSSEAIPETNNTQTSTGATVTSAPTVTPAPKQGNAVVVTPVPTAIPTLVPISDVVLPTVEPTNVPTVMQTGMSFYDWLREAQNTESGALWGTFDEENAQRITFIEGEEISGYANLMVAGKYFSVDFENRKFSDTQKASRGIIFNACDKHEGFFFDWHSKATGTFVRYELTPELVDELKEVAVSWVNEDGEIVYGVLCCKHNSSGGSSNRNTASNAGGGGNNSNPTTPPTTPPTTNPTPTPPPTTAPTREPIVINTPSPDPTPRPADNQEELEGQGPREDIDHDNGHNDDPAPKPADNQQELAAQGTRETVNHDNGHSSDPAPKQEGSGSSSSSGHSSDPAPKQEGSGSSSSSGHSSDPAPKQEGSGSSSSSGHSSDPGSEEREDLSITFDW